MTAKERATQILWDEFTEVGMHARLSDAIERHITEHGNAEREAMRKACKQAVCTGCRIGQPVEDGYHISEVDRLPEYECRAKWIDDSLSPDSAKWLEEHDRKIREEARREKQ